MVVAVSMTKTIMVILAVLSVSLIATVGTTPVFAESSLLPFQGSFEGYDTEGDDYNGSFVDYGLFSVFDGIVETQGVYEFIEDTAHEEGGYYATTYTISDESGNSLSFYDVEISFLEYGPGKYGMSQTEWTITGGEGKFSDASGEGQSRVWFNLEDWTYKGITSGTVVLPS
jgi:hypothetical protein